MAAPSYLSHLARGALSSKLSTRSLLTRSLPAISLPTRSPPTRSLATKAEQIDKFLNIRHLRLQNGKNVGAAVFTSIHNIAYYSNYVYCSMGRPYALLVTKDSSTTVSSLVDGGQPWRRSHDDNIIYTDWSRDNFIASIKHVLGDNIKNIGVEMDHMNLQTHQKLLAAIPGAVTSDLGEDTGRQRMIKSEEEMAVTRIGAAAADVGGEACKAALRPGVEEWEVGLEVVEAMTRYMAANIDDKAEIMDAWAWIQSGINSDGCHNPMTRRKVVEGDIIMLNCFPESMQGYYNALERTFFLGHADSASLKYWETNCDVHRRGLELIKPGVKCSDIAKELNEMLLDRDMLHLRTFGYGHSFGVISHYYGREPGLELREDVDTVLQPGMILSMEPMLMIPEGQPGAGGYREHDCLIINYDGTVENVTKFPFGPEHNVVKCN